MDLAIMYHYVCEPEDWKGSIPISPKKFEEQLDKLGSKYEFVLPQDLNRRSLKPRCVLTFDDATKDQYQYAFDIMKKKGIPGYFTVMSGPLEHQIVPIFHLVHAALSLIQEPVLWKEMNLITTLELDQLQKANTIYSYESSILRRYIKYALNFIFSAKQSRELLECIVYDHYGSKEKFIENMYINVNEFGKMKDAGMELGVHCAFHEPYRGEAMQYYQQEIEPCAKFMESELNSIPKFYTPPFGGGENMQKMIKDLEKILLDNNYKRGFLTSEGYIDRSGFWSNRIDCNKWVEN